VFRLLWSRKDAGMGGVSKDVANRTLINLGFFEGLQELIKTYDLSPDVAARAKAELFSYLLLKIAEGQREVPRIQAALARMEHACRRGTRPDPGAATAATLYSPDVTELIDAMTAFDGWTISLLETMVTLLASIRNPETAGLRVNSLKGQFADLWYQRAPGQRAFMHFDGIFNQEVFVR
jgi:hypothetical protein